MNTTLKVFGLAIVLTMVVGCSTMVPVKNKFPTVPEVLLQPPVALAEASESEKLSDFLLTVTDNYAIAYSNSNRLLAWQSWYLEQRKVFDEEKEK